MDRTHRWRWVRAATLALGGLLAAQEAPLAPPAPSPASTLQDGAAAAAAAPRPITLREALRLAHTQGRDKKYQNEQLELLGLSLQRTKGDFRPIFSGHMASELYGTGQTSAPGNRQSADLGVTQVLPGGGTASATTSAVRDGQPEEAPATSTTTASLQLTQPLLRGAGSTTWREPLTAAERAWRYGLRTHRRYVQGLSLQIAQSFWALQNRQFAIEQDRKAKVQAEWSVEQAKANMELGKANATALDVFRAETQLFQTVQRLVDDEAAFAADLDGLKISLALAVDQPISIDQGRPQVVLMNVDSAKAIALALGERSDLISSYDAIEDSERQVTIARRNMLPQLDANAGAVWNGTFDATGGDSYGPAPAWTIGLHLTLPFDRHNERFAYDSALIQRQQTARNAEIKRSQVIQEVQKALQDLRSAEATLTIQERNRTQMRLKFEKAGLDLNAGQVGNREVVDAQNDLTAAENGWFQSRASYYAAELALRHAIGVFTVREDGSWDETPPPYAAVKTPQPSQARP